MKRTPHFASAQPAVNLKSHEATSINPAYLNLTESKTTIQLARTTPYIWALTGENHVVLGVERPWDHPDAFVSGCEATLQKIHDAAIESLQSSFKEQAPTRDYLEEKCGLGHPTLSTPYATRSGDMVYGQGKIFIAGQLSYDEKSDAWVLSDKSGRFYRVQGRNVAGIEYLLGFVAGIISKKINCRVVPQMEEDKLNPEALWKKTNKKNADKSLLWRMFNIIGKVYKHVMTEIETSERMVGMLHAELSRIEEQMLSDPLKFKEKQAIISAIRFFRELVKQEENPEIYDELNLQIRYMIKSIFRNTGDSKKTPSISSGAQKKPLPEKVDELSGNRFAFLAAHSKIRSVSMKGVTIKIKRDRQGAHQQASLHLKP